MSATSAGKYVVVGITHSLNEICGNVFPAASRVRSQRLCHEFWQASQRASSYCLFDAKAVVKVGQRLRPCIRHHHHYGGFLVSESVFFNILQRVREISRARNRMCDHSWITGTSQMRDTLRPVHVGPMWCPCEMTWASEEGIR